MEPWTSTEFWAVSYFNEVMKGLAVRPLGADFLPEELLEVGTSLRTRRDLEVWAGLRASAEGAWLEYIARALPLLRQRRTTGIPERSRLVAVIVEPRCHPHLEFALRQTMSALGSGWALVVFHGGRNEAYAREQVRGWDRVHLVPLGVDDLSRQGYADFRRSARLFDVLEGLGAEKVLFFECDGVLLRPGVERFMRYVNTGAPWHWGVLEDHDAKVGNGGVCLRDVAWCREALRFVGASEQGRVAAERYRPREEDICFSQAAFDMRAPVAPPEVAAAFCVETIVHPAPLAVHKPWPYVLPSDLRRILELPEGDYRWRAERAWREAGRSAA